MTGLRKGLIAVALFAAVTCALLAQDGAIGPIKQLSVDVDIILVPVAVTNDQGQFVGGLDKQHFKVFEDKVEQEITYFSTEDAPMSLGIVLDASGSMNPIMNMARANGGACTDVGTEDDEYFLVVFSDKLKVNTDFTSDLQKLRMALLTVQSKGQTALYDAIYAGIAKVKTGTHPRKALVVVSDGFDNHSRYNNRNVREAVKESDVQLYLIGNEGDGALTQLAENSGGRNLSPRTRGYELGNICTQVVKELKNQYLLGYHSTNLDKDGKWRNITVKLSAPNNIRLNARPKKGYYAPSLK
jgi:Ca-activated chloride channel family protein